MVDLAWLTPNYDAIATFIDQKQNKRTRKKYYVTLLAVSWLL